MCACWQWNTTVSILLLFVIPLELNWFFFIWVFPTDIRFGQATPLEKTFCHWLQIKHTVSWVQSTIEQSKTIIWPLISLERNRKMYFPGYGKECVICAAQRISLTLTWGHKLVLHILFYLPCCYQALELIYRVLSTKRAFTGWSGTCNCRVTASLHSPANSDSFLSAMAIGSHKKLLFLSAIYLIELDMTSRLQLKGEKGHGEITVTYVTGRWLLMGLRDVSVYWLNHMDAIHNITKPHVFASRLVW